MGKEQGREQMTAVRKGMNGGKNTKHDRREMFKDTNVEGREG